MVYLTLRGIAVSRLLHMIEPRQPSIAEVHPSATIALRGGPIQHVLVLRENGNARRELLNWLEGQGMDGVATTETPSSQNLVAEAHAYSRHSMLMVPCNTVAYRKENPMNGQHRNDIRPGILVKVILKKDQRTGKRTAGVVKDILTSAAYHSRGIKVRLHDGQIGRVQGVLADQQ